MKTMKIVLALLIAGFVVAIGSQIGDLFSITGTTHLVPTAEARVGRPLTPVSVAGVARRTVRRCAVGVYRCTGGPGNRQLPAGLHASWPASVEPTI